MVNKGFPGPGMVAAGECSRLFSGDELVGGFMPDNAFTPVDKHPADYGHFGATGTAPPGGVARRSDFSVCPDVFLSFLMR